MSRYHAPTPLMLALLKYMPEHRATCNSPMGQAELTKHARPKENFVDLLTALIDLVDQGLAGTMIHTKDGLMQAVYWPTAFKPIVVPLAKQDPVMPSESKNAILIRLLTTHGAQNAAGLSALAMIDGHTIATKNIGGLLSYSITHGDVLASKTEAGTIYDVPRQEKTAPESTSEKPLDDLDERLESLQKSLSDLQTEHVLTMRDWNEVSTTLAEICRALDVPSSDQALGEIDLLHKLADELAQIKEERMDVIGTNGNDGLHYDAISHPHQYTQGTVECIEAIQSALTPEEWRGYCKGNALKYIWRERHKEGDNSMRKAKWYLERALTYSSAF